MNLLRMECLVPGQDEDFFTAFLSKNVPILPHGLSASRMRAA